MEKDIGKIKKNENIDIVVRIDDFGGRVGLTVREYMTGENYTGFTKAGTRIPAESFAEFKELINSINEEDLKVEAAEEIEEEQKGEQVEEVEEGQETLEGVKD